MTKLISFGGYNFPDTGIELRDNFAEMAIRETRLAGLDGTLDENGDGAGVSTAGRIEYACWLKAATPGEMAALRDALKGLALIGVGDLVIAPEAGVDQRYTRARVTRIDLPEIYAQKPSANLRAAITWAAATPRWFGVDSPTGSGANAACSGAATDLTRTHNGNAAAYPVITVTATSVLSEVRVQRRVGGDVVDEVAYEDGVGNGDMLIFDTRALAVTLEGSDAYGAAFSALGGSWLRLLPGANSIRVILGSGETANVSLTWEDTYF
jgi:hypothetical protein